MSTPCTLSLHHRFSPLTVTLARSSLLLAGLALVSGCASPGPPRPPSLSLPAPVKDLRGERIGAAVHLTWTTPDETTDGLPIKLPLSAEICRDEAAPARSASGCTVVRHLAVAPGASTAQDVLPPELLHDPVVALAYRIRVLNARGRSVEPVSVALAATGAAPEPIIGLHAVSSAPGIRLLWQATSAPSVDVLLLRSLANPPAASAAKPSRKESQGAVRLLGTEDGHDRGGTIDRSVRHNDTYSYVAWRARSVSVAGHALTLRSEASAPVAVTVRNGDPPHAPTGLEAIADAAAVDLSWQPNTEPDLVGYLVERLPAGADRAVTSPADSSWTRLTERPVTVPAFRDAAPLAGESHYRVLAIDGEGNVGEPSDPASVSARSPSPPDLPSGTLKK